MKVKITRLRCRRCGYEWPPRQEEVTICPKCKSPLFDKDRVKKEEK
ncbi:hypothetical protein LCGC14_1844390 [marine sediment metagenome]|uniref:Rubredoxin-like domain-containing protein n=1 Tax=marine sediment metagenome TaxID=412755 RepID=A0A0F9H0I3_9ZZZZ